MTQRPDIWVVEDDEAIRYVLQRALSRSGYEVQCFETVADVSLALGRATPRAIITDIRLPDADGLNVLDVLQGKGVAVPVIAMTAYSDLDQAVKAFQKGAVSYTHLTLPTIYSV